MIFDKNKVYTAVNADELHKGDFVFATDFLNCLKKEVTEEEYDPKPIAAILPEKFEYRFSVGEMPNTTSYALAYLVCPAKNAEAYKAWREGKAVERRICEGKEESLWLFQKPGRDTIDDWCLHTFRVARQEEPSIHSYLPYKDVDELISDFKERFSNHIPAYAMPLIWVQKKCGTVTKKKLITAFNEEANLVSIDGGEVYDMDGLYKDYTFLDGSPCGVEEV